MVNVSYRPVGPWIPGSRGQRPELTNDRAVSKKLCRNFITVPGFYWLRMHVILSQGRLKYGGEIKLGKHIMQVSDTMMSNYQPNPRYAPERSYQPADVLHPIIHTTAPKRKIVKQ